MSLEDERHYNRVAIDEAAVIEKDRQKEVINARLVRNWLSEHDADANLIEQAEQDVTNAVNSWFDFTHKGG